MDEYDTADVDNRPGATSWKWFTAVVTLCLACACGLVFATGASALPVTLALSGGSFKISADRLEGNGFVQFARLGRGADDTGRVAVATGLTTARIHSLCQSALVPTPLGPVTMRITAGADAPVLVDDLVIDLVELTGSATLTELRLGVDAATVGQVGSVRGDRGQYAHQAGGVVIDDLKVTAHSVSAGTFRLGATRLDIVMGSRECF